MTRTLALSLTLAAASALGGCVDKATTKATATASPPAPAPATAGVTLQARFGDWPFLTPLDVPDSVPFHSGGAMGIRAETCGACHRENYAEWQNSTHAHALRDPQYLAELAKPSSPRWLCLNCHIPLQDQRAYLVDDKTRLLSTGFDIRTIDERPNPGFDRALQQEAITCATCHVRAGADGRGVVLGPRGDNTKSPHVVSEDPRALRDICLRCHSPGAARLTPTFVCWFETGEELAAGPYAGTKTCVDCHMPETTRPIAAGGPVRTTRQHHWQGGGVPKSFELYDALPHQGFVPGLVLQTTLDGKRPVVTLENKNAGHVIPTADPERHYLVRARLLDETGTELARDTLRIGQRWDWGSLESGQDAHRLEDTRLRPQELRTWRPKLPDDVIKRARTLAVDAVHVRLAPENARFTAATRLDDELEALAPGAGARIAALSTHYPLLSFIAHESVDLASGARVVDDLPALLTRSKALRGKPLAEIERLLR